MNGQEVESPTHRGTGCHSCSAPDQVGLSPSPVSSPSVDASSGQRSFILDYPGDGNRASCMGSGLAWWSVGVAGAGCPACRVPLLTARFKANDRDFPGGTVDKGLPANAGGHRFDPSSGKIPHATEQLSQCTTTTEARVPRACPPQQGKPL